MKTKTIYQNISINRDTKKVYINEMFTKEKTNIIPSIAFTNCVLFELDNCYLSEVLPFLRFIACEHNLKLHKHNDFKKAKLILMNSVKFN